MIKKILLKLKNVYNSINILFPNRNKKFYDLNQELKLLYTIL
jgi:hypothetical protein